MSNHKPIDEYQDPDTFYSEIAKQVGIPKIVYEVVEEKFGWKNDDKNFRLSANRSPAGSLGPIPVL